MTIVCKHVFRGGSVVFPAIATMAVGFIGLIFALELARAFAEMTVTMGRLSKDSLECALAVFGVYGTTIFVYIQYMRTCYRRFKEWLPSISM